MRGKEVVVDASIVVKWLWRKKDPRRLWKSGTDA